VREEGGWIKRGSKGQETRGFQEEIDGDDIASIGKEDRTF